MKFRKKPVVVEAVQYVGDESLGRPGIFVDEDGRHYVVTIHGQRAYLAIGDWVITEPDGAHYYPCKPDIFEATYEPGHEDWCQIPHATGTPCIPMTNCGPFTVDK